MSNEIQDATKNVLKNAEANLNSIDSSPFSMPAFETLKERISNYISDLIMESIKISKRYRSDTISATHVEQACDYLITNSSRKYFRHLGTVGGILLGASISTFLTMINSSSYNIVSILLSAAFGISGSFLVAMHIVKD